MIALDTSTNGGNATATSLTFSHTCSGSNRILHVAVATPTADNTDYVTGVTYGGIAMTRVDTFRSPGLGGAYLYELVNPALGANNVVISASGSVPIYGASLSHTGALQTGQPDDDNGNAADPVANLTVSVTTVASNVWLVSMAARKTGSSDTLSASTNTTARQVNAFVAIGDSNAKQNPPGSFGQTWALSGANGLAVIVVSIKPAPETGGGGFLNNFI